MSTKATANKFTSATAIFTILEWLETKGPVTVRSVRHDLSCSDRQARDYLAFLEGRGLLRKVRRGRANEYHVVHAGQGGSDALAKAVGTELAVAALGALRGTTFHEAALDHVKTLRRDLHDRHGPLAERLRSAFHAVRGSTPTNPAHGEHAEEILEALMRGHRLRATYELVSSGEIREYLLRPLSLVVDGQGLHLLARKADRKLRTFDVEGFCSVERVRGKATPPPDVRLDDYFADAFGRYTDFPPADVEVRCHGEAARRLRRRSFHSSQVIVQDEADVITVRYRVGLCPEFKAWLLGLSPEVEVVAPCELRDEIRRRLVAGAALHAE